jgi:hypothetical protein
MLLLWSCVSYSVILKTNSAVAVHTTKGVNTPFNSLQTLIYISRYKGFIKSKRLKKKSGRVGGSRSVPVNGHLGTWLQMADDTKWLRIMATQGTVESLLTRAPAGSLPVIFNDATWPRLPTNRVR